LILRYKILVYFFIRPINNPLLNLRPIKTLHFAIIVYIMGYWLNFCQRNCNYQVIYEATGNLKVVQFYYLVAL